MKARLLVAALATAAALAAAPVHAGLFSSVSLPSAVVDFEAYDGFVTAGPELVGPGITFLGSTVSTLGAFIADLGANGTWGAGKVFAGLGAFGEPPVTGAMEFHFSTLQSQAGAFLNAFAPGAPIEIAAFGSGGALLESYFVPVFTPGGFNEGAFYAIGLAGPAIEMLRISGHGVVLDDLTVSAVPVPEPETWALMLAGLGLVGVARRRRSRRSAGAMMNPEGSGGIVRSAHCRGVSGDSRVHERRASCVRRNLCLAGACMKPFRKSFRKSAAALAFAASAMCGAVQPAAADVDQIFNLGLVGPAGAPQFVFQPLAGLPAFIDSFNFSVAGGAAGASAVALDLSLPGFGSVFHISGFNMALFDSSNSLITQAFEPGPGMPMNLFALLLPGSYHMSVSGDADGSSGGQYSFAIAAIPEPGNWALLLVGLAALGGLARRKRGA